MKNAKRIELGNTPLFPLMMKLALPSILAQAVNILYNIVDRIYIGHMKDGSLSLTGIGLSLPVIMCVSAFALMAGSGGAPLAAIKLGEATKDENARQKANLILQNASFLLLFFSVALGIFFLLFLTPLLFFFGASNETLPYACSYLKVYLLGTIFVQATLGLNPYISAQGHAKTAMASTVIGAFLNMVLDPIFIFCFGWGVKGAAFATVLSQMASSVWVVCFLSSSSSSINLFSKQMHIDFGVMKSIVALGISPFVMYLTESAIIVVLNFGLQKYGGDIFVASMTILQSLMQLCNVPLGGFTQGVQPIISFNFGSRNMDRVKKTSLCMIFISTFIGTCFFFLLSLNARFFVGFFTNDSALLQVASKKLPIYFGAMWLFGLQMGSQSVFVGLGKAKTSLFIACLRKLFLLIPLALILPVFFGVDGIFFAEPIASTLSALASGVLFFFCYEREIKEKLCKEQNIEYF